MEVNERHSARTAAVGIIDGDRHWVAAGEELIGQLEVHRRAFPAQPTGKSCV